MKKEEYKYGLWKVYLEKNSFIAEVWKEDCLKLGEKFLKGNVTFLYEVYYAFVEQERFRLDEQLELEYERIGKDCFLRWQGAEWIFDEKDFKEFLATMIEIFEDVLPLGSVVELKKEFLAPELRTADSVRMVIVQRYVGENEDGYYYPYAATVYPTGIPGSRKLMQFTSALIGKVVSRGFSDEQEEAYVYLMKQELLLEKHEHSIGFAGKEELDRYEEFLKGRKDS